MLKTICYISDSKKIETGNNFEDLFEAARANNIKNNITGILIYRNSNFLQVLEGEQTMVDSTFKRIRLDVRHHNLFKIIDTTIEQRFFQDYNCGFTVINDSQTMHKLKDYLEWLKSSDDIKAKKIISIVENFIIYSSKT